jgi:YhcH/YjgK/YiaL family protein
MTNRSIFTLIIFVMITGCSQPSKTSPELWSEKELNEWFAKGEWKQGWAALPDETVNQQELAIQYHKNPERWNKVFAFLKENNLEELPTGRHELEGPALYVNVDEYVTKNEEDARFEAHRKYADIQYVVSGEERIGVLPLEITTVSEPYKDENDIVFLATNANNFRNATAGKFFIFFPDDAHQPCVRTGENAKVRKIVAKVLIN